MMTRLAPAAMIFVPSAGGISHNAREHAVPGHLEADATPRLAPPLERTA